MSPADFGLPPPRPFAVEPGRIFCNYDMPGDPVPTWWMIDTVTKEENATFEWLVVMATWSAFGAPPRVSQPQRFIFNRRRKEAT